jgi:DNA-binding NarL/FixJ family response regulator
VRLARRRLPSLPAAPGPSPAWLGVGRTALTPREREVLRLIASGLTYKEVAGELVLSPNTVRSYGQSILEKLKVRNRIEALRAAAALQLL